MGFVEAEGGWGFQIGELPYLPDHEATHYKHPLVTGWSAGITAGYFVGSDLAVTASWEYREASTRKGSIDGVIDRVQGNIHYHTFSIGARIYRPTGPGWLRAEFAAGLALPFRTEEEFDYDPALARLGVAGSGSRTIHYNLGYGAQAQFGYELPVYDLPFGHLYAALSLEMRAFQSNNRGRETELDNFITDLAAVPPAATTTTFETQNGGAQPEQYAVSDITWRLAVGMRF
ncbi:MAG TPA: hypothetical protein VHW23_37330 [Kofleriaceae bacterium]|nr:hypothetical protein [Kofleriaceae bacterium]